MKKTGIVDEPIKPFLKGETGQDDRLGINDYAQALQTFIENTDTPMTVGIQGEWGSGKTSLMNKIWKELEGTETNTRFESIWINTWEHSLLKSPEETLISIVNEITRQVSLLNPKSEKAKKMIATGKKVFTGALKLAAGVTMGLAGKEVADDLLSGQADNSIRELRSNLEDFINSTIEDTSTDEIKNISKIVFYIDDLDRIEPKDAVKILELLKNIFSLKHCVFILAIDYQVIIKGLKDKFGEKTPENEREFRSFFDKIIQLPFTMPISKYHVSEYVISLLEEIGFIDDKNQMPVELVEDILHHTIGGNPRSLKRLINNLSLINIINQIEDKKDGTIDLVKEDSLLIFALICCQVSYPKIYDLLTLKPNIKEWNEEFAAEITQKKEELDPHFKGIFDKLIETEDFDEEWEQTVFKISYISLDTKNHASNISRFLSLLVNEKLMTDHNQLSRVLMNTSATVVSANRFRKAKIKSKKRKQ
jgi:Cdc6-like AAA superfamily ATPase